MRITELLKKESIETGRKGFRLRRRPWTGWYPDGMPEEGLRDTAGYKEGILAREALGSTAIGEGIAIPHAKVER